MRRDGRIQAVRKKPNPSQYLILSQPRAGDLAKGLNSSRWATKASFASNRQNSSKFFCYQRLRSATLPRQYARCDSVRSECVCQLQSISDLLPLCFTREYSETQGRKIPRAHVGNPSGGSTKVITRPRMGPAHPDPRNRPIAQSRMITFLRYLTSFSLNRAQGPDDVTFTISYYMVGVAG